MFKWEWKKKCDRTVEIVINIEDRQRKGKNLIQGTNYAKIYSSRKVS